MRMPDLNNLLRDVANFTGKGQLLRVFEEVKTWRADPDKYWDNAKSRGNSMLTDLRDGKFGDAGKTFFENVINNPNRNANAKAGGAQATAADIAALGGKPVSSNDAHPADDILKSVAVGPLEKEALARLDVAGSDAHRDDIIKQYEADLKLQDEVNAANAEKVKLQEELKLEEKNASQRAEKARKDAYKKKYELVEHDPAKRLEVVAEYRAERGDFDPKNFTDDGAAAKKAELENHEKKIQALKDQEIEATKQRAELDAKLAKGAPVQQTTADNAPPATDKLETKDRKRLAANAEDALEALDMKKKVKLPTVNDKGEVEKFANGRKKYTAYKQFTAEANGRTYVMFDHLPKAAQKQILTDLSASTKNGTARQKALYNNADRNGVVHDPLSRLESATHRVTQNGETHQMIDLDALPVTMRKQVTESLKGHGIEMSVPHVSSANVGSNANSQLNNGTGNTTGNGIGTGNTGNNVNGGNGGAGDSGSSSHASGKPDDGKWHEWEWAGGRPKPQSDVAMSAAEVASGRVTAHIGEDVALNTPGVRKGLSLEVFNLVNKGLKTAGTDFQFKNEFKQINASALEHAGMKVGKAEMIAGYGINGVNAINNLVHGNGEAAWNNVKDMGVQGATQAGMGVGTSLLTRIATKFMGKESTELMLKGGFKLVGKKIPFGIGALVGVGFGVKMMAENFAEGKFAKGVANLVAESADGILSTVPGFGTLGGEAVHQAIATATWAASKATGIDMAADNCAMVQLGGAVIGTAGDIISGEGTEVGPVNNPLAYKGAITASQQQLDRRVAKNDAKYAANHTGYTPPIESPPHMFGPISRVTRTTRI